MRTLLISPDGMLGRAFREALSGDAQLETVSFPVLDLCSEESVNAALQPGIRRVINCAAYTQVDAAESDEEVATQVNGHGVGRLARRCRELGATLLHFGTDYVFDGHASAPYPVDAPIAPQGAYGRSKALGEALLAESGADHLYVRTSWLYAPWAKNFVRTIARLGKDKPELKVVADQRGRTTSAEHLAATALALLAADARGTFHVTDGGECTWFEFAQEIVRITGGGARVLPCTSDEYPTPTKRPPYSVLDLSKTEGALGREMPRWQDNLASVCARLEP